MQCLVPRRLVIDLAQKFQPLAVTMTPMTLGDDCSVERVEWRDTLAGLTPSSAAIVLGLQCVTTCEVSA